MFPEPRGASRLALGVRVQNHHRSLHLAHALFLAPRETPQKNGEQGVERARREDREGTRPADGRAARPRAHLIASSNGYGSGGHQKEVDWFAQPTREVGPLLSCHAASAVSQPVRSRDHRHRRHRDERDRSRERHPRDERDRSRDRYPRTSAQSRDRREYFADRHDDDRRRERSPIATAPRPRPRPRPRRSPRSYPEAHSHGSRERSRERAGPRTRRPPRRDFFGAQYDDANLTEVRYRERGGFGGGGAVPGGGGISRVARRRSNG